MHNDRLLIPVLHVANDTKFLRLEYTRVFTGNYPPNLFYHKNANVWVV